MLMVGKTQLGHASVWYQDNCLGAIIEGEAPHDQGDENLADALALMWLDLKAKGIIK